MTLTESSISLVVDLSLSTPPTFEGYVPGRKPSGICPWETAYVLKPGSERTLTVPFRLTHRLRLPIPLRRKVGNRDGKLTINGVVVLFPRRWRWD